jgi:hypothetical protein
MVAGPDGSPPWSPSMPFVLSDANAAALMVVGQGLGCPLRSYWRVSRVYTHVDTGRPVGLTTQPAFCLLTRFGSSVTIVPQESTTSAKNMLLALIHFLDRSLNVVYD